jgi:hypothetical protein
MTIPLSLIHAICPLQAPYFDASFSMISGLDLMALPFIHEAVRVATKVQRYGLGCTHCAAMVPWAIVFANVPHWLHILTGISIGPPSSRCHQDNYFGMQMVMEMVIVYPNKMEFPVMEDFGIPPPPLGMLEVTVRVVVPMCLQVLEHSWQQASRCPVISFRSLEP